MGTFTTVGNYRDAAGSVHIDPRVVDILTTAASASGYNVEAFSGVAGRSKGTKNHPGGFAVDIRLVDPTTGKALPNYQNAQSFSQYEQFAQVARAVQQATYPELNDTFRWGGYFAGGPNPMDMMHFDINPSMHGAMGGGSWDNGANEAFAKKWGITSNGGLATANGQRVKSQVATQLKTGAIKPPAPLASDAPVPQTAGRYIDEQRLRYQAEARATAIQPVTPATMSPALAAARRRLADAKVSAGKITPEEASRIAPRLNADGSMPEAQVLDAEYNPVTGAFQTDHVPHVQFAAPGVTGGVGALTSPDQNGYAVTGVPVANAPRVPVQSITGRDVTPTTAPRANPAQPVTASTGGTITKAQSDAIRSTGTGAAFTNPGGVIRTAGGLSGTVAMPAGARPASVPSPVLTGGLSPTERDERNAATRTVSVANPAYAEWEKKYGDGSQVQTASTGAPITRNQLAAIQSLDGLPPTPAVAPIPAAPPKTIVKTVPVAAVAGSKAALGASQPNAAALSPIYESGGYIYLQRPDGTYARQGRAEVSGNNIMGALTRAGVEGAGLNYGGPWTGLDEARSQLMLNPDAWRQNNAALQGVGSVNDNAALRGTGTTGGGTTYVSGGYLYAKAPDGSFKKIGKTTGAPQPVSNPSRLEADAQGTIDTGFTSGTSKDWIAETKAYKDRYGNMTTAERKRAIAAGL